MNDKMSSDARKILNLGRDETQRIPEEKESSVEVKSSELNTDELDKLMFAKNED